MERLYAVIIWSAPWKPRIQVRKVYDNECLTGIGWRSACEFDTYKSAMQAARELRNQPEIAS